MKNTASPIHIGVGGGKHAAMQRSSWVRTNVAAAVCIAGSALVASEAIADAKLVPATVCQPLVERNTQTSEDPADVLERITNIRYSFNGRVLNQHPTRRLGVACPILRDNTQKPLRWIKVIAVDNHPEEVLECEARAVAGVAEVPSDVQSLNSDQTGFDAVPPAALAGTGTVVWRFRLDDVESGDASHPNFDFHISHYTLTCQIPPRYGLHGDDGFSWIASIMIDEP